MPVLSTQLLLPYTLTSWLIFPTVARSSSPYELWSQVESFLSLSARTYRRSEGERGDDRSPLIFHIGLKWKWLPVKGYLLYGVFRVVADHLLLTLHFEISLVPGTIHIQGGTQLHSLMSTKNSPRPYGSPCTICPPNFEISSS